MKVLVIAVAHRTPAWVENAVAEYVKRLPREWGFRIQAVKPAQRHPGEAAGAALEVERDRILAHIPARARSVVLDERGRDWTTRELAAALGRWRGEGRDLAFVIGSADGVSPALAREADPLLSLSRLTLPHALARVVLVEQLYRAWSVLSGHPYHRD